MFVKVFYIEKEIWQHKKTLEILDKFPEKRIVEIDSFSEVFNRKNQSFRKQKDSNTPFILAKKQKGFVQKNPDFCTSHFDHNFYFSTSLNCSFDCEYCFLQGMYRSAYFVLFVNTDDFKIDIQKTIKDCSGKAMFFSAYDNDGLALDAITGFSTDFVEWFAQFEDSLLEIRTKSANIAALKKLSPTKNTIIAFTLSPKEIQEQYEKKTATLDARVTAINELQSLGWKVAVRIEPLIYMPKWEGIYSQFFEYLAKNLKTERVENVYFGVFKLPKEFLKSMQKMYPESKLFHRYFEQGKDGEMTYEKEKEKQLVDFVYNNCCKLFGKKRVFSRLIEE